MGPTPLPSFPPEDDRDAVVVPLAPAPKLDGPRQTGTSALTRRTLERRWVVVSVFAHFLIVGALMFGLIEAPRPVPLPILKVTLVARGPGGAGAAGGNGGTAAAAAAPTQPEMPPPTPEPVSPPAPSQPELPPPTPAQPEIPKPTPSSPELPPPAPSPIEQPPQTPPPPQPPKPMAQALPPPAIAVDIPPPKPRHIPPPRATARRRAAPAPQSIPAAAAAVAVPSQPAPLKMALAAPGTGPSRALGAGSAGAGKGAIGTSAGPGDDYLERLYRHLLRYKKYPPEALSAKQQGSVVIGFTIARDGTVSAARIEQSSGSPALDQATLAMVRHASPAPPLPGSFTGGEARVKFPIDYKLGLVDQMF